MWKSEKHPPNWYRDVPEMKYLILGSFPPPEIGRDGKKGWDYLFYYPNSKNRFWEILADIAEEKKLRPAKKLEHNKDKKAVEERYKIMCLLKVGVQNMGLEIKRRNKSAKDTDIRIEEFQDIRSIIKDHNELKKILLVGYSASNSTAKSFLRYLKKCKNELHNVNEVKAKDIEVNKKFFIEAFGRKIECVVLNSTSTAAEQAGITKDILLKQFNEHLV